MICPVCKTRLPMITGDLKTSWDTCEICTGLAVQALIDSSKVVSVQIDFNQMIGCLDRLLSEFLLFCVSPELDEVNAQTLKHHADDLIGVGNHALKKLADRGVT